MLMPIAALFTVIFLCTFILSLILTRLLIGLADRYDIFDSPETDKARRIHKQPIPRIGGIAIFISTLSVTFIFDQNPERLTLIAFPGFFFLLGLFDDVRPVPAFIRLLLQLSGAIGIVFYFQIYPEQIFLTTKLVIALSPLAGILLGAIIIVGAIQAINWIDGLDGLAGGIMLLGIATLAYYDFLLSNNLERIMYLVLPVLGSILGFLRYNTHPARIFMGDGGSNWLGSIAGMYILLLLTDQNQESFNQDYRFPAIVLIMPIAMPVMDTALVIINRIRKRQSPMKADKTHFHHALLDLGLSQSQAVITILFFAMLLGIAGSIPIAYRSENIPVWWVPYTSIAFMLLVMMGSIRLLPGFFSTVIRLKNRLKTSESNSGLFHRFATEWERINRYTIYLILLTTPFLSGTPDRILGYAALTMLAMIITTGIIRNRPVFIDSVTVALTGAILLIVNNMDPLVVSVLGKAYQLNIFYNSLFIFLFLSSAGYLLLTIKKTDLVITATDFALAAVPITLMLAPEQYKSVFNLGTIYLKSLVLMFGIRVIAREHSQFLYRLRLVSAAALIYIIMVALFDFKVLSS